jgi:hypothetical protein
MKRGARLVVLGLVLAGLAWYVWHARKDLAIITRFDVRYLVPMLLVPLGSLWVNASIGRRLVRELGVDLTGFESYALSTVNALGNYLPLPQAGAAARGVYLKTVHRLAYSTYAASVIVTFVTSLALSGVLGLAGLAVLRGLGRTAPWQLWIAFAALAASMLLFTPAGARVPLPGRLKGFREGLSVLRCHHLLSRVVALQAALIALTATGMWLACRSLPGGQDVTWLTALMLGLVMTVSAVVNVLGIEQAAAGVAAHLLNVDPKLGFLASALFRVMAILVVFATGPLMAHWLARRTAQRTRTVEPEADAPPATTAPHSTRLITENSAPLPGATAR